MSKSDKEISTLVDDFKKACKPLMLSRVFTAACAGLGTTGALEIFMYMMGGGGGLDFSYSQIIKFVGSGGLTGIVAGVAWGALECGNLIKEHLENLVTGTEQDEPVENASETVEKTTFEPQN